MVNYLLLALPMFLNAVFTVTYVFTASSAAHRCNIPECDSTGSALQEPWVNFTIPVDVKGELSQCTRYSKVAGGEYTGKCDERGFDNGIEKCEDFIVDKKQSSISNEVSVLDLFFVCYFSNNIWMSSRSLHLITVLTRRCSN